MSYDSTNKQILTKVSIHFFLVSQSQINQAIHLHFIKAKNPSCTYVLIGSVANQSKCQLFTILTVF